jgi:hypothetical protein
MFLSLHTPIVFDFLIHSFYINVKHFFSRTAQTHNQPALAEICQNVKKCTFRPRQQTTCQQTRINAAFYIFTPGAERPNPQQDCITEGQ